MRLAGGLLLLAVTLAVTWAVTWAAPRDMTHHVIQDGGAQVPSVRHKRGFRASKIDRVGHGYGKRQSSLAPWGESDSLGGSRQQETGRVITDEDFAILVAGNPSLASVLVKKFVDIDGDGFVTTDELFGGSV